MDPDPPSSNNASMSGFISESKVGMLSDIKLPFIGLTSELSGAALAASGGGPEGRNVLERLVRFQ